MAWWFLSLAFLGALYAAAFASRLLVSLTLLCLHPPKPKDLRCYGPWAVVTGPTSGIDRSVALELARRGLNLLLVEVANLQEISDAVRSRYAVKTAAVVSDLSLDVATPQGAEAARRLQDAVEALDVGVLVNNAGVVTPGAVFFHEADVEEWMRMIRVNLWGLTEVTAAVLPGMVRRGRGAVLNMGSASSEAIPSFPLYTIYTATKRYVAQFSSSLYAEYSKGIDVQCQVHSMLLFNCIVTYFSQQRRSYNTYDVLPVEDIETVIVVCSQPTTLTDLKPITFVTKQYSVCLDVHCSTLNSPPTGPQKPIDYIPSEGQ